MRLYISRRFSGEPREHFSRHSAQVYYGTCWWWVTFHRWSLRCARAKSWSKREWIVFILRRTAHRSPKCVPRYRECEIVRSRRRDAFREQRSTTTLHSCVAPSNVRHWIRCVAVWIVQYAEYSAVIRRFPLHQIESWSRAASSAKIYSDYCSKYP